MRSSRLARSYMARRAASSFASSAASHRAPAIKLPDSECGRSAACTSRTLDRPASGDRAASPLELMSLNMMAPSGGAARLAKGLLPRVLGEVVAERPPFGRPVLRPATDCKIAGVGGCSLRGVAGYMSSHDHRSIRSCYE